MVLTILRATGVVIIIEEGKDGGFVRWHYRRSVVLTTKTLKALPEKIFFYEHLESSQDANI
jgi:hypothetical protein